MLTSTAAAHLELPLPREQALAVCRAAIARIDWELVEGEADLTGRQDPARLCCNSAPVAVDLELSESGEHTRVALRGSVAGLGPVASRDLRAAMSLLASAIGASRELRRSADPPPTGSVAAADRDP